MMENAGRNLADLARKRFFEGAPVGKSVLVLAGRGGNGGGALVAARRLANWGARIEIALAQAPDSLSPVAAHQLEILKNMGVSGVSGEASISSLQANDFDLILDGLIGYSLNGAPYGLTGDLIEFANRCKAPIAALDTPSGVDPANGQCLDPSIRATVTLTLALPKIGLLTGQIQAQTGELYLADISVPPQLYEASPLSLKVDPIFADYDIVRILL
jgi:NAD(P)H-hydrate epimerase